MSIGTRILDAASVKRYVTEQRELLAEQIPRDILLDIVTSRAAFKPARQRLREYDLILQLLAERRHERPSALLALKSDVFAEDADSRDPAQELEDVKDPLVHTV